MTTKVPNADSALPAAAVTDADGTPIRILTPAAQRALAEADARRKAAADTLSAEKEVGGRDGPDPVRFGDWEKGGIASDF